jgi:hypothetical protein
MVCGHGLLPPEYRANGISSGLSEEQITDIFSSAGKVERFRLVYDAETGKPKGFGFADYPDTGMPLSSIALMWPSQSHA